MEEDSEVQEEKESEEPAPFDEGSNNNEDVADDVNMEEENANEE